MRLEELTTEEQNFLALLYAVEDPIPAGIAGKLSPVSLELFYNLLGQNQNQGLVRQNKDGDVHLAPDLPAGFPDQLKQFVLSERFSGTIARLNTPKISDQVSAEILTRILDKADRHKELALMEMALAREALGHGDPQDAMGFLSKALERLYRFTEDPQLGSLFVKATQDLLDLCFALGKGSSNLFRFLKKALATANRLGDRRSSAMIHLHFSAYYRIIEEQQEASSQAFSEALHEIEDLGDEDILTRSAGLLASDFYVQGLFKKTESFAERAAHTHGIDAGETLPIGELHLPTTVAHCLAHLGHLHDAVGTLECYRRAAKRRSQDVLAANRRASLGVCLQMFSRDKQAFEQLSLARQEALETNNLSALGIVEACLAYALFLQGDTEQAGRLYHRLRKTEMSRQFTGIYSIPHVVEILLEMGQAGFASEQSHCQELERITNTGNIHLKGIACRMLARMARDRGEETDVVRAYLSDSERLFLESGDPVQLARTWIEMTRLALGGADESEARTLARKAYAKLPLHAKSFYPKDLQPLLKREDRVPTKDKVYREFIVAFMTTFHGVSHDEDLDVLMRQMLKHTCRLLGAERGAVVRMDMDGGVQQPVFWLGRNFSQFDLKDPDFWPCERMICDVAKDGQPRHRTFSGENARRDDTVIREALCFPLKKAQHLLGAVYYDNIYLENGFHLLDSAMMRAFSEFMSGYVAQALDHAELRQERMVLSSAKSIQLEQMTRGEILHQSRIMQELLAQADQIASTESTVLILGETGVGKELLARRIHLLSDRRSGPLEIMDLTGVPETLLESELFGYEKGAFTGAVRQKHGRIELADKGTIFLDEVGDIPLSFQVKLLRVLQEKTFRRLGGTQTLSSDFRLIAATNQDLQHQIEAGTFRQDLFYRLNGMVLSVPALRDRGEDTILLAEHFLGIYAQKHNKTGAYLSREDIAAINHYPWPGNVRELKNMVERAVLLSRDGRLDFSALQSASLYSMKSSPLKPSQETASGMKEDSAVLTLEEVERRHILSVLKKTQGKISGRGSASEILKIHPSTLYSRMKKLGLK